MTPDQNPHLLPCPFCGGGAQLCDGDIVQCSVCIDVKQYPVEAWNTRAVSPDVKILREKIRICLGRLGHMHNKETHENWYFMESLKDLREILAATAEKGEA